MDSEKLVMTGLVLLVVGLIALGIWAEHKEQQKWEQFAVEHNCKEVEYMKGSTVTGVGPSVGGNGGIAVTVGRTPDKVGYLCDDGKTYWRDK